MNIRSGVALGDIDYEFGDGLQVRVLRPAETIPPIEPGTGKLIHLRTFQVAKEEHSLPVGWQNVPRIYWARFENVFGEEFETRNPSDARQPAAFMRVTELAVVSDEDAGKAPLPTRREVVRSARHQLVRPGLVFVPARPLIDPPSNPRYE